MLSAIEQRRLQVSRNTEAKRKSQFGQFLTPERIAGFMVDLFPAASGSGRLLDAGAGIGSLSAAFVKRWRAGGFNFQHLELDAYEIDHLLHTPLSQTLKGFDHDGDFVTNILGGDFIQTAVDSLSESLFSEPLKRYTHAILNPPYKKIRSSSTHRLALRQVGIETVNLYTAFVALAVALAAPGGQIVAIIPRSFCNGPYYKPFREYILERTAIRRIHLFESRRQAFKDDEVLQENIIVLLERDGQQGPVSVSTSTDDTFVDLAIYDYPFERVVARSDPERFIHVPTSPDMNPVELSSAIRFTLHDLGIKVSTGPVVDYRLREHLRDMPEPDTVPLLYPAHCDKTGRVTWPIKGMKKPNAIVRSVETEKWLYPVGHYCVVRRFTSKEERRRIVASVVGPEAVGGASDLGFENHLNLFHEGKRGLPEPLAHGLAVFLNTTAVDEIFRRFNGHTQVNATDLRLMKYPSRDSLVKLGNWAMQQQGEITNAMKDAQLRAII